MRIATFGGGLVLAAALLTGCGSDEPPADASEDEFCDAYSTLYDDMEVMASDDTGKMIEAMKEWSDAISESGTPEDIPAEAREGYELLVEEIDDVDPDATEEELDQIGDDMGDEGEKTIDAFSEWATETCPPPMPDMGELEDMQGELEGDLEGDLEGELQEQLEEMESESP